MISEKLLKNFEGKSTLVTGGTGLIGRQVVKILCDVGADVRIASLDQVVVDSRAKHLPKDKADLSSFDLCKDMTRDTDYVFHLAGVKGSAEVTKSKPASFMVNILMMNTNILEACRLNRVNKVVYTSSIGAYAPAEIFKEDENVDLPPMDLYPGEAKRIAEKQVQAYAIQYGLKNFAIVRPCNVYGPGDNFDPDNAMVIPTLMFKVQRGDNPVVMRGDGTAIRDFAYSRDIAEGIILALWHGTDSRFVNLSSGVGNSVRQLVETFNRVVPFNYVFGNPRPGSISKMVMEISLAQQMLDFQPMTSLEEGLRETWSWFLEHKDEYLQKKNYFAEGEMGGGR